MRLKNKVAIVTGSSSGLGRAIADTFLREGAKVIYSDINEIQLQDKKNSYFIKCDTSKANQVKNLIKNAVKKFGSLDIMVNNAGIGSEGGILEETDQGWDKTISVNLSGVFYGIREAGKYMRDHKIQGSIINMSSILGKVGFPNAITYCAAKGGVVQLTHAASLDVAKLKIRVNAIAPGFIKTSLTENLLKNKAFKRMLESNTPLGYIGEPQDIANTALYLASDDSKYVTGEVIYVDGGWRAR